jgi:hypothetical protein
MLLSRLLARRPKPRWADLFRFIEAVARELQLPDDRIT